MVHADVEDGAGDGAVTRLFESARFYDLTEQENAALAKAFEAAAPHLEGLRAAVLTEYAARMATLCIEDQLKTQGPGEAYGMANTIITRALFLATRRGLHLEKLW